MLSQRDRRLHAGNAKILGLLGLALLIAGNSGAMACRDAKNGKIIAVDNPDFVKERPEQYVYRPDGSVIHLKLGTSSRSKELHFCVDLELPTPSGTNAGIGLYFWRNEDSIYTFQTTGLQFSVVHTVFDYPQALVSAAPFPVVSKQAPRMREVEFEAYDGGARISVDGRLLTDFVARPPSGDLSYGLVFWAKDKSTVLRFARPTAFGQ